jgi:hypothetical protein
VITELVGSREVFDAAVAAFGEPRVHAPALLRLRRNGTPAASAEVA